MFTTKRFLVALSLGVISGGLQAQNEVWVCEDPVSGQKTYHNIQASSKGCKKLEGGNVSTVPAPKGKPSPAPATGDPKTRVAPGTQNARDLDRKQIFTDELNAEQKKLDDLKKEFNGGEPERKGDERNYQKYQDRVKEMKDNLDRTESNIKNLQREIGRIQ